MRSSRASSARTAGTGTVLAVAEQHDRDSIGIDLDARNATIAAERIPTLTVDGPAEAGAA